MPSGQIQKTIIFVFGSIAFALGVIGAFLPILPSTPFFLLAAWCFMRSSPKAHEWLYRQPLIGKALTDWDQTKSISRRNKTIASLTLLASITFIILKPIPLYAKVPALIVMCTVMIFILTRRSS